MATWTIKAQADIVTNGGTLGVPEDPFTFTVSDLSEFAINVVAATNLTVNWGNGSSQTVSGNQTITAIGSGASTVTMSGICTSFTFGDSSYVTAVTKRFDSTLGAALTSFHALDAADACTSVPADLLLKCINITSLSFDQSRITGTYVSLATCTKLTSVVNLYRGVQNIGTTIPSGYFSNNPLITDFSYAFAAANIDTIPSGLFDYCTTATNFSYTFQGNPMSSAIPGSLFDNCVLANNFTGCFTSIQCEGAAPDIWTDFPLATGTDCFTGSSNLNNYASIPSTWGGGGP